MSLAIARDVFTKCELGERAVVFNIKTHSGRSISAYSYVPVEEEVLLMPGTRFIVTAHVTKGRITHIFLVEVHDQLLVR